jgi:hypothetical protein
MADKLDSIVLLRDPPEITTSVEAREASAEAEELLATPETQESI